MRRAALLLLAAASTLASSARADDATDLEALLDEPVIVSASKSAEAATVAPATSTLITAESLREHGIHSLDEAVNYLSLGMIVENPIHNQEIGARGVLFNRDYGDHVLLLLDGHVLNEAWDGSAYFERATGVPFEMIDHLEVVLGPGSVLYGSNAVLGVINIVTKRAKDWPGFHAAVESELPISMRGMVGVGRSWKLFGKDAEVTFGAEYYAQKGPTYTFDKQHAADDFVTGMPRRFSFDASSTPGFWGGAADQSNWSQVPAGYARVSVGPFQASLRASMFRRGSPFGSGAFNSPDNHETERWLSGDIKHRAVLSASTELSSRLYADSYDYVQNLPSPAAQDCREGMNDGCLYKLLGFSRWIGLEEQLSVDWLKDGSFVTLVGVDGRLTHVGSQGDYIDATTQQNPGAVDPYELDEKTLGAYAQQTAKPLRWLSFNAGVRLDVHEGVGSRLSPRLAGAVSPWKGGTLKLVYAEAFRAPNAYERFNGDPTYQVASPGLSPEVVQSVEASFEQKVATQRVLFGVFRTWFHDLVSDNELTQPQIDAQIAAGALVPGSTYALQYQNLATVDDLGWNAAYDGSLANRRLRYGATVTGALARSHARPDDPGAQINVAAQFFGNARIAFDLGEGLPTVGMVGRVVGRRPADQAFTGTYNPEPYAPAMVELRWTLSGRIPGLKQLSYRASLNVASSSQAPYVVGPGSVDTTVAPLGPVDQVRTSVGLGWDFDP